MQLALVFSLLLLAAPPDSEARLSGLVREYFRAGNEIERDVIAKRIVALEGLTPQKLSGTIRGLQLWEKQTAGEQRLEISIAGAKSQPLQVVVQVPQGYAPAKRWPLLIAYHGQNGRAEAMLEQTRVWLSSQADQFIVAAPQDIGPIALTSSPGVSARPRELVNALRRRYHIDSDRVFLLGYSEGSHNAWMSAIMDADCFAGVVPLATPLQVIGGDMLYDEILPNVRNAAVLYCWGADDNLDPEGQPSTTGGNAGLSRKMVEAIGRIGLSRFQSVELPNTGHLEVSPPGDKLSALLKQTRERWPKKIHQAFRLPAQSDAYWVSSDRFLGEPLPAGNLEIPVPPEGDPLAAEKKWLVDHLGLIEAECQGQTISLTTRRSGNIILLLSDDVVKLDQPVTIIRNQKKRLEKKVPIDLRVMLREAARSWDFDRLPVARVVVPVGGAVKFGYPEEKQSPPKNPTTQAQPKEKQPDGDKKKEKVSGVKSDKKK